MLDSIPIPVNLDDQREPLIPSLPASSPVNSRRELRECISEPHIRLDDGDLPEDDSRSCGSEGESRVIVEHHSHRHREQLLGSLGSSTSSSCGSIPRGDSTESNGVHHLETATKQTSSDSSNVISDPLTRSGDTSDPTDTSDSLTDTVDPLVDTRSNEAKMAPDSQGNSVPPGVNSGSMLRRSSTLREESSILTTGDAHKALHKSKSLNVEREGDLNRLNFPPQLASRRFLNSSAQTLVPEDECDIGGVDSGVDPGSDTVGGRGDSGIDPGSVEEFTFPPSNLTHYEYTATSVDQSCDQGDHTPICTSPSLNPVKYHTAISKVAAINVSHDQFNRSHDQGVPFNRSHEELSGSHDKSHDQINISHDQGMEFGGSHDQDYFTSPVHSRFSFSGTSSDELTDLNFVTPTGRSVSPFAQSWTSSECSFSLPTPSTPWAPPSSPLPPLTPHSLPTSPSHYGYSHSSINRPLRKSHEITSTLYPSNMTSCLRKTPSSGRPHSCRNSALFPDGTRGEDRDGCDARKSLNMEEELKRRLSIKSVHFVDADDIGMKLYSDDEVDLERFLPNTYSLGAGRPRSKSNPQSSSLKAMDSTSFPPMDGEEQKRKNSTEYAIRLKYDVGVNATTDPHSCKGYRIAQRSNTRLSSSTPDLSKVTVSFLMGPSTAPS